MENVLDPAHVTVSHHGVAGNRYKQSPFAMVRENPPSEGNLMTWQIQTDAESPNGALRNSLDLAPPSLVRIRSEFQDGGTFLLVLYASPSRPGWTRHMGCQVLIKDKAGRLPPGVAFFTLPMPVWLSHVLASLFLHQDMVFLHHQEQTLAERGYALAAGDPQADYATHTYTPGSQDLAVLDFRKWLQYSAGRIPWASRHAALPPRERRKEALFDVFETHIKHCRYCSQALRNARMLRNAFAAAAFAVVALRTGLGALALGGVLAAVAVGLQGLVRLFHVYEFEHAAND